MRSVSTAAMAKILLSAVSPTAFVPKPPPLAAAAPKVMMCVAEAQHGEAMGFLGLAIGAQAGCSR